MTFHQKVAVIAGVCTLALIWRYETHLMANNIQSCADEAFNQEIDLAIVEEQQREITQQVGLLAENQSKLAIQLEVVLVQMMNRQEASYGY